MKPEQLERILRHLAEWSRHAFDEFSVDELERAAADAERDGDYAAAVRLHDRASAKRQAESALR